MEEDLPLASALLGEHASGLPASGIQEADEPQPNTHAGPEGTEAMEGVELQDRLMTAGQEEAQEEGEEREEKEEGEMEIAG